MTETPQEEGQQPESELEPAQASVGQQPEGDGGTEVYADEQGAEAAGMSAPAHAEEDGAEAGQGDSGGVA